MRQMRQTIGEYLRSHGVSLGVGLVLVGGLGLGLRFALSSRRARSEARAVAFQMVNIEPDAPKATAPPPKPVEPPKVVEPAQVTPVSIKAEIREAPPPDAPTAPPPAAPSGGGGGGGTLGLDAEAEGEGDDFGLAAKPGGRGLLSGGGLGEGAGTGIGDGEGPGSKWGWYYALVAGAIQELFQKTELTRNASARVQIRVWADGSGRIERAQLLRSTGSAELDEALRSMVGTRVRQPPPPELPMPMVILFTARRPG